MRIVALLWRISEAAFAEVDAFAWVQGWQITRTWHTHSYRDRRFDALISCRACAATGRSPTDRPCGECRGTGRVNLKEPPITRRPEQPSGGRP
ncbi:hypothetical protein [Microbispora sp. ATCC PTA-5024]|uniref:hypothetical protein n=1 Tax=Microbispora sp. ATCC PTA-5024 TaxID=316330 RepID=UPI0003DDB654|nr:hypothetical protein [Microbispora sp. ATCC PTA-5024]ETK33764.1 hypothetical protein MPTA5024_22780 [Microbispora sp. ATCC PTA-5024]